MFNPNLSSSIITFAKKLENQTLRQVCGSEIEKHDYRGKGNFGQILEKFYFGYEPNSDAEPDFKEAKLELKSSPLKKIKNGDIRTKETVVLNIITYKKVHKEDFENSSFMKKNSHILFIFYLHDSDSDLLDYLIEIVGDWKYSKKDLQIIKRDWEIINQKIREGNAHLLSEGDTFYLGACTKGATALKSLREQPFNKEKAKQRAYSLKQGYVNHIISSLSNSDKIGYGKIIEDNISYDIDLSIEEIVVSRFKDFYGKSTKQIENHFNLELNKKAKNYFATITNAVLGIELGKKIEEFEKADIITKTIRIKQNNLPKEDISFPAFKYEKIINEEWEDSEFKNILESKFFFVFYQYVDGELILKKVKFWNMNHKDIQEAKKVWNKTVSLIKKGKIVKELKNKRRYTFFPSKKDNSVSHIRPHAKDASDNYPLPVKDIRTGVQNYTKHSFWINNSYIKDVYLGLK